MTDAFNQLKSAAQTAVKAQEAKQIGWLKANRKPLLIGAAAMLVIWIMAHHFGIG